MKIRKFTLCFPISGNRVLLGKKTAKIGKGLWNGIGGNVEPTDKSIEDAVIRENFEEVGIVCDMGNLEKRAVIHFHNNCGDDTSFMAEVHVYLLHHWEGEPKESPELSNLTWFSIYALPVEEMMLADKKWLPLIFDGEIIRAKFWYGPGQKTLERESQIMSVDEL